MIHNANVFDISGAIKPIEAPLPTSISSSAEYNNFATIGSPTISNKIVSGFNTSNYLILPEAFNPGSNPWEICLRFSYTSNTEWDSLIGSDIDFSHGVHMFLAENKVVLEASSNNSSWNITKAWGVTTLSANTYYYYKVVFTGSQYIGYLSTDGETWNTEFTVNSSTPISVTRIQFIGAQTFYQTTHYLHGSLDLTKCYIKINNNLWWSPYTTLARNFAVVGSPTIAGASVNNFSATNYLSTSLSLPNSFTNITMFFKVRYATGSGSQLIFYPIRTIDGKCGLWDTEGRVGSESLTDNKDYWIKLEATPSEARVYHRAYVAGETRAQAEAATNWTYDSTSTNIAKILPSGTRTLFIGTNEVERYRSEYWKGYIYLNDCYIKVDNNLVWYPVGDTTGIIKVLNTIKDFEDVFDGQTKGYKNDLHMNSDEEIFGCKAGTIPTGEVGDTVVSTTHLFLDQNKENIRDERSMTTPYTYRDNIHYFNVGNPTVDSNYIASDFTTSDYIVCGEFNTSSTFTIYSKIMITATNSGKRYILGTTKIDKDSTSGLKSGIYLGINSDNHFVLNNSDGTSWETEAVGATTIQLNTWYWIKIIKNSSTSLALSISTNGSSYTGEIAITTSKSAFNPFTVGAPFGGREEAFVDGKVDLTVTRSTLAAYAMTRGYLRLYNGSVYSDETQGYIDNPVTRIFYLPQIFNPSETYRDYPSYCKVNAIWSNSSTFPIANSGSLTFSSTKFAMSYVNMPTTYNTFDALFKVKFSSSIEYQVGICTDTVAGPAQLFKIASNTSLKIYNTIEGDIGDATLTHNTMYWMRCYSDGSTFTLSYKPYVNGETSSNVDFTQFTTAATTSHPEYMIPNKPFVLYIGRNADPTYTSQYWASYIYLADNYIKVDGTTIWNLIDPNPCKICYAHLIKPDAASISVALTKGTTTTAESTGSICTPVYLSKSLLTDSTGTYIIG